ncbi:hypothetical protein [Flavobacterium orientale]|uniref:Uncharacterized protein n=1 Tax=Flavobacterium orientale TaxID=1756020 RepID=A0A916Y4R3_9FLAO|nr:hypothetical protein [Flavobacterium orientale]GGD30912.1 hypothetical protein GCM10011343_21310 [Flavobacterium orientale]
MKLTAKEILLKEIMIDPFNPRFTVNKTFDELDYVDIRHNAFYLIVFSHNGFTQPAKDFAFKNKIMIFDSTQLAHIISEDPNKDWKCLNLFD